MTNTEPLATLEQIKEAARASQEVQTTLRGLMLNVNTVTILHRISDPVSGEYVDVLRQGGVEPRLYLVYVEHTREVHVEATEEHRTRLGEKGKEA
jgi:hypothetical protein